MKVRIECPGCLGRKKVRYRECECAEEQLYELDDPKAFKGCGEECDIEIQEEVCYSCKGMGVKDIETKIVVKDKIKQYMFSRYGVKIPRDRARRRAFRVFNDIF